MSRPRRILRAVAVSSAALAIAGWAALKFGCPLMSASAADRTLDLLNTPPGLEASVFARVPGARSMALSPDGRVVFVGTRDSSVWVLLDADGDGGAEEVRRFLDGYEMPNGIVLVGGDLLVGSQDAVRIHRGALAAAEAGEAAPEGEVIVSGLHDAWHHGWRYMGLAPDGRLALSLGAPCNICDLAANTGKIVAADLSAPSGPGDWEVLADGVRNSVGLTWDAEGRMWFTDNGADHMGDDLPADELNTLAPGEAGVHFGFPWRGGRNVALTGAAGRGTPPPMRGAAAELQPHGASLGIAVLRAPLPGVAAGEAVIAQHGSWNRSEKVGHRLVRVTLHAEGRAGAPGVWVDGWLQPGEDVYGRPVDVKQAPDGALLVSDDHADVIWRFAAE